MKPTYPINYRGGWMQPAIEYVPEVRKSRPTWKPNKKLPDYGPVIDEAPRPRQSFEDRAKSYQKVQYREPFHTATPVTEFINEPHILDPIESIANKAEPLPQSSLREPLRNMNVPHKVECFTTPLTWTIATAVTVRLFYHVSHGKA